MAHQAGKISGGCTCSVLQVHRTASRWPPGPGWQQPLRDCGGRAEAGAGDVSGAPASGTPGPGIRRKRVGGRAAAFSAHGHRPEAREEGAASMWEARALRRRREGEVTRRNDNWKMPSQRGADSGEHLAEPLFISFYFVRSEGDGKDEMIG